MSGAAMIAAERERQLQNGKWTSQHDDGHVDGRLAIVAAMLATYHTDAYLDCESLPEDLSDDGVFDSWGLVDKHHGDTVRSLAVAGALIAAEIDRLQRAQSQAGEGGGKSLGGAAETVAPPQTRALPKNQGNPNPDLVPEVAP